MPGRKRAADASEKEPAAKKPAAKKAAKADPKEGKTLYPVDALMKGPEHAAVEGVKAYRGNVISGSEWNIISWNVNGLRALMKKGAVMETLRDYEKPHFICLQEIKLDEKESIKLGNFLDGYQCQWNCCSVKKGYSGTAVLIRDDIAPKVTVSTNALGSDFNEEGRIQIIEVDDFTLINTYVPNSGAELARLDYRTTEWDVALRKYMVKLAKGGKGVIWTGDLNVSHMEIDLANPKGNVKNAGFTPQERNSFSETLEAGFTDTFRELHPKAAGYYSYWGYRFNARASNKGWRLDYFIVNDAFFPSITASSILPAYEGSDHCPIQLLVKQA